jgi:hypothetical protein
MEQPKMLNNNHFNPSGSGGPQNPPANPGSCRVYTPNACSLIGMNEWNIHNVNQNPIYSAYRPVMHGMIKKLDNDGLRLAQKRSFIPFEIYNQGCTGLYCLTEEECPQGTRVENPTNAEKQLFDNVFQSIDLDIGNSPPTSCNGIKYQNENSSSGWVRNEHGKLIWMERAEEKRNNHCRA